MPIAKMPRVLLPAADPAKDPILDAATPDAVEVQVAYVYLFLIVEKPPTAKIPFVPSSAQTPPAANPNPCADIAPRVITAGMVPSLELRL